MPAISGAGWTAGMAGPLKLEDLCCSEEQRPVECVVVLSVHDVVECEGKSRSRGDKTDFVWVQITLKKDSCSSAAVIQGCVWILMMVSYVFKMICRCRDCHYYKF